MYLLVFSIGGFFQLFNKKILFIIFTTILILLASFRYGIGMDYFAYRYLYDNLNPNVLNEIRYGVGSQEIGFRIIGATLKWLGFSYQQYLLVFSVVTMIFFAKIAKKYTDNPTLSMFILFSLYYLTWVFSAVRQGLVISVGLFYLLEAIKNDKIFKFSIIVLVLSTIHSSAWYLIVLYYISKKNFTKLLLIKLTALGLVFSLLPVGTIISKMSWMPFYNRILPYLNDSFSMNLFDFQSVGRLAFLLIAFFYYDAYTSRSEMDRKIMNMYIINLSLYFFMQFSELTAARITIYGRFFDMIILTNILYIYRNRVNKFIYMSGILLMSSLMFYKETEETGNAVYGNYQISPYVHVNNYTDYGYTSMYESLILQD